MYQLEVARSWAYFDLREEVAKEWIDAGVRRIELSLSRPPVDFDDEEFVDKINQCKEVVDKYEIEILSVHLPFGPDWELCSCDDQLRDRAVNRYVDVIRFCSRLHPKRYVLHPGFPHVPDEERAQRMKNFRHSAGILAEAARPAKIAVENMAYDCLGNTSDELISLVDGLDNICVCCDMNHWLHEKNYDAIRKLGSRIETIHVSDYDEIQEKHWLPGEGVSDWNEIIEALCSIGYNGPFLYECVGTGEVLAENKKMLFDAYYQSR